MLFSPLARGTSGEGRSPTDAEHTRLSLRTQSGVDKCGKRICQGKLRTWSTLGEDDAKVQKSHFGPSSLNLQNLTCFKPTQKWGSGREVLNNSVNILFCCCFHFDPGMGLV